MNKEYIYKVLRQQAIEWTGYPTWGLKKEYFQNISYHNWAVNEVLKQIRESSKPPQLVIAEFMKKMDDFSKLKKETRNQFEVARDAAEWMLDVINGMMPPEIELKGEEV